MSDTEYNQDFSADEADHSGSSVSSQVIHPFQFPWKLHEMLDEADSEGFASIVSWLPDGSGFKVHKKAVFSDFIMPRYFNQTKYRSFQRQLNSWGFKRITTDVAEKGGYKHAYFIRSKSHLCNQMKREKTKRGGGKSKSRSAQRSSQQKETSCFTYELPEPILISPDVSCASLSSSSSSFESSCPVKRWSTSLVDKVELDDWLMQCGQEAVTALESKIEPLSMQLYPAKVDMTEEDIWTTFRDLALDREISSGQDAVMHLNDLKYVMIGMEWRNSSL